MRPRQRVAESAWQSPVLRSSQLRCRLVVDWLGWRASSGCWSAAGRRAGTSAPRCTSRWAGRCSSTPRWVRAGRGGRCATDDVMLWYSSGKPLTTVAVLQLWERGAVGLDDRVGIVPARLGGGQGALHAAPRARPTPAGSRCGATRGTTATSPSPRRWRRRSRRPALFEPGTAAAYHAASGWRVLGGVVEAVDGRPIDRYLREEVIEPLGLASSSLGIPLDVQAELGDRLVPVVWTGHRLPTRDEEGGISMVPYKVDQWHNEPWHVAKVEPGGGMRGPARELGRFYEALLGPRPGAARAPDRRGDGRDPPVRREGPDVRPRHAVGPGRAAPVHRRAGPAGVRPRRDGVVAGARRPGPRAGAGGGGERPGRTTSRPSSGSSRSPTRCTRRWVRTRRGSACRCSRCRGADSRPRRRPGRGSTRGR